MTDDQFAHYLAGFFDGEGSVYFRKGCATVRVSLCNTNREVMKAIHQRLSFGDLVLHRARLPRRERWDIQFLNLALNKRFLNLVKGKVTVKREKVETALQRIADYARKKEIVRERWGEMRRLYEQGLSQREIANRLGVSYQYVNDVIREYLKLPFRTKKCKQCGGDFTEFRNKVFCSKNCYQKYWKRKTGWWTYE